MSKDFLNFFTKTEIWTFFNNNFKNENPGEEFLNQCALIYQRYLVNEKSYHLDILDPEFCVSDAFKAKLVDPYNLTKKTQKIELTIQDNQNFNNFIERYNNSDFNDRGKLIDSFLSNQSFLPIEKVQFLIEAIMTFQISEGFLQEKIRFYLTYEIFNKIIDKIPDLFSFLERKKRYNIELILFDQFENLVRNYVLRNIDNGHYFSETNHFLISIKRDFWIKEKLERLLTEIENFTPGDRINIFFNILVNSRFEILQKIKIPENYFYSLLDEAVFDKIIKGFDDLFLILERGHQLHIEFLNFPDFKEQLKLKIENYLEKELNLKEIFLFLVRIQKTYWLKRFLVEKQQNLPILKEDEKYILIQLFSTDIEEKLTNDLINLDFPFSRILIFFQKEILKRVIENDRIPNYFYNLIQMKKNLDTSFWLYTHLEKDVKKSEMVISSLELENEVNLQLIINEENLAFILFFYSYLVFLDFDAEIQKRRFFLEINVYNKLIYFIMQKLILKPRNEIEKIILPVFVFIQSFFIIKTCGFTNFKDSENPLDFFYSYNDGYLLWKNRILSEFNISQNYQLEKKQEDLEKLLRLKNVLKDFVYFKFSQESKSFSKKEEFLEDFFKKLVILVYDYYYNWNQIKLEKLLVANELEEDWERYGEIEQILYYFQEEIYKKWIFQEICPICNQKVKGLQPFLQHFFDKQHMDFFGQKFERYNQSSTVFFNDFSSYCDKNNDKSSKANVDFSSIYRIFHSIILKIFNLYSESFQRYTEIEYPFKSSFILNDWIEISRHKYEMFEISKLPPENKPENIYFLNFRSDSPVLLFLLDLESIKKNKFLKKSIRLLLSLVDKGFYSFSSKKSKDDFFEFLKTGDLKNLIEIIKTQGNNIILSKNFEVFGEFDVLELFKDYDQEIIEKSKKFLQLKLIIDLLSKKSDLKNLYFYLIFANLRKKCIYCQTDLKFENFVDSISHLYVNEKTCLAGILKM